MQQRGRLSASALNIVPIDASRSRPKLNPIGMLSKDERRVFDHVARENPHLKPADVPMLELYVMAHCRTVAANKRKDAEAWEREARVTMALGTKLRITPQATQDPRRVARLRAEADQDDERKPWDR